jgi:hypothetical protein
MDSHFCRFRIVSAATHRSVRQLRAWAGAFPSGDDPSAVGAIAECPTPQQTGYLRDVRALALSAG